MRRILSFSRISFYFWIYLVLDFIRIVFAPVRRWIAYSKRSPQIVHRVMEIRKNQSAVKAHINSHKNKISEEQIRRIGVIRD